MKIGKIILTTACSLLMSGAAFAKIVPTLADNSALELSVVSARISAADDDYGEMATVLDLLYDNFTGKAVMNEQTLVHVEWNFGKDKKSLALPHKKSNIITKTKNSIVPPLDGNKSDSRSIFEKSLRGRTKKDVHNWSNTITHVGIGAAAGATGGTATPLGPVAPAVAGGLVGVVTGVVADVKETHTQITRDEERYQNGTNSLMKNP